MKTCLSCAHCRFDMGWPGTDATPGDPTEFKCQKGHWNVEDGDARESMEFFFENAERCADFQTQEQVLQEKQEKNLPKWIDAMRQSVAQHETRLAVQEAAKKNIGESLKRIYTRLDDLEHKMCIVLSHLDITNDPGDHV